MLICESEPLLRAGVRAAIEQYSEAKVIGEAIDVGDAVTEARKLDATTIVVNSDRLEQLSDDARCKLLITGQKSAPTVIMLLDPTNVKSLINGFKSGIRGFVSKSSATEDLLPAFRGTLGGGVFFSGVLVPALVQWIVPKTEHLQVTPDEVSGLSIREFDVLNLLGRGHSNAKIAAELYISETTVRSHTHNILTKLNLQSRSDAVILGYRLNLS